MSYRIKLLKVKLKSLAAEQSIIRLEKSKAKKRGNTDLVNELQHHKILVVRSEARATHMAYGILRGKTPEQIEPNAKTPIDQKKVDRMVKAYGPPLVKKEALAA